MYYRAVMFCVVCCLYCIISPDSASAITLVVDQKSSRSADTNPGSEALPFRTVGAAVKVMKPGDTVAVKDGIYRESLNLPAGASGRRITLKAWKGHHPAIKGSDVVSGKWRKARIAVNIRRGQGDSIGKAGASGQTPALLQAYIDYLSKKDAPDPKPEPDGVWQGERSDVPFVGIYACPFEKYTQMVFVDGKPLAQIGPFEYIGPKDWKGLVPVDGANPDDMCPGTFCYDKGSKMLYVWLPGSGDPSKHLVEASVRYYGIMASDYVTISGITAMHYQMKPPHEGGGEVGICGDGKEVIVENCIAKYNDFSGIIVQGDDCVIRNCEMAYNGNDGFTSSKGRGILFTGNNIHHNNTRQYVNGWHDGGLKVTNWRDVRCIGNYIHDEPRTSLWFDINCVNVLVADNLFERCGPLYYEISRWGIIVNNVFRDVDRDIWSYSSDVLIANNILDGCAEGITITGDARAAEWSGGWPEQPHGCLAAVRNNLVVNNIIINSVGSYIAMSKDSVHCGNNLSDHNVFVWTFPVVHGAGNHIKFMAGWDDYYGRLPIWQDQRHNDLHSTIADPEMLKRHEEGRTWTGIVNGDRLVGDPGFVDRVKGDYRLRADSPLKDRGIRIPDKLRSFYYRGIRPWAKTLIEDAPNPEAVEAAFEAWGQKHYRIQPEPAPLLMFDLKAQLPGTPGLVETWTKSGRYPSFEFADSPR